VREALLATPFAGWHGLWTQPHFSDPLWHGLITSAGWALLSLLVAWLVFSRRTVRVA
jgi:hypothetical protein